MVEIAVTKTVVIEPHAPESLGTQELVTEYKISNPMAQLSRH